MGVVRRKKPKNLAQAVHDTVLHDSIRGYTLPAIKRGLSYWYNTPYEDHRTIKAEKNRYKKLARSNRRLVKKHPDTFDTKGKGKITDFWRTSKASSSKVPTKRKAETQGMASAKKSKYAAKSKKPAGGYRNPRFVAPKKQKRSRRKAKKVLVNTRQVKKWNKASSLALADISTKHYHFHRTQNVDCDANKSKFSQIVGINVADIDTALLTVKMADTTGAAPTFHSTDLDQGTGLAKTSTKIKMKVGTSFVVGANYAVPCWVDVYCLVPKEDTGLGPVSTFESGLPDVDTPSAPTTLDKESPFVYPTWSADFNNLWKIKEHKRVCLQPGEVVYTGFTKRFTYDPAQEQNHALTYQATLGSHVYAVRLQGTVCHESTDQTLVGWGNVSVDTICTTHMTVEYEGGLKMRSYEVNPNLGTLTTPVCGAVSNFANTKETVTA